MIKMIPEVVVVALDQISRDGQVLKDYRIVGKNGYTTIVLRYSAIETLDNQDKLNCGPFVFHKSPSQQYRDNKRMGNESQVWSQGDYMNNSNSTGAEQSGHGWLWNRRVELADRDNCVDSNQFISDTVDIGIQCGASDADLVDGECQTCVSYDKVTAVTQATQTETIQTRNMKVGCRPEVKSCRIQTETKIVKSTGVGCNTPTEENCCQTFQTMVPVMVDVGAEPKQILDCVSRHSQTFCKLVTSSTNTTVSLSECDSYLVASSPQLYCSQISHTDMQNAGPNMSIISNKLCKDSGLGDSVTSPGETTELQVTPLNLNCTGTAEENRDKHDTISDYVHRCSGKSQTKAKFVHNIRNKKRNNSIRYIVQRVDKIKLRQNPGHTQYFCILDDMAIVVDHC
jgi:hypothetical protein